MTDQSEIGPRSERRMRNRILLIAIPTLAATAAIFGWVTSDFVAGGSQPSTPPVSTGTPPFPPLQGSVTDPVAAAQIGQVIQTWLELQQSPVVPNVSNSPSWPTTRATYANNTAADVVPSLNQSGNLYIAPDLQSSMVTAANQALENVTTPSEFSEHEYWVKGALASESDSGFQVVGAGAYATAIHFVSQTATSAIVDVRATSWQHQVYKQQDGSLAHHSISNGELYELTLTPRENGGWLVSSSTFGYVPGQGP